MRNTHNNPFVGDHYTEDYANVLVNHCNDCQYNKECKKSLTVDEFWANEELSWDSSQYHKDSKIIDNLDDKLDEYYMRQQMIMHLTAHEIFRRSPFSIHFNEVCHDQYCILSIEQDIENMYNDNRLIHQQYNIHYWYRKTDYQLRMVPIEYLSEYVRMVIHNNIPNYADIKEKYCQLYFGYSYDELTDDECADYDDDTGQLYDDEILLEALKMEFERDNKPKPKKTKKRETRISEEALTQEERVIRWASQRGGAINL